MTNVITVYQPHASLIMAGVKTWETRPAPPHGDMRPDGVRGLPGRRVNAGDRIGIHAANQWDETWLGYHDRSSPACDTLAYLGADMAENDDYSGYTCYQYSLPLGVILGTVRVVDVLPIVDDRLDAVGQPGGDTEAILVGDNSLDIGDLNGPYRDLTDQLPYGHWLPGNWGWELADPIPTTELCPVCEGKPCPECGGSGAVDAGTHDFGAEIVGCQFCLDEKCSACNDTGSCPPIPVKGKQGVWEWKEGTRG